MEIAGNANGDLRRQRAGTDGVGVLRIGQGGPGLLAERRLFQLHQLETAHQRSRRPIVEKHRLAAPEGRTDRRIQRRAGAGAEVRVAVLQPVGLELLAVDDLAGPAGRAVVETPLGGLLGIAEQRLVARQVGDRPQLRRLRLDASLRVALDQVLRHPPALGGALHRLSDGEHLARLLRRAPHRATPGPLLPGDLDIVLAQGVFHGHGIARQRVGLAAVAFFQYVAQQVGGEHAAFPVQPGEHHFARVRAFRRDGGLAGEAGAQGEDGEDLAKRGHAGLPVGVGRHAELYRH